MRKWVHFGLTSAEKPALVLEDIFMRKGSCSKEYFKSLKILKNPYHDSDDVFYNQTGKYIPGYTIRAQPCTLGGRCRTGQPITSPMPWPLGHTILFRLNFSFLTQHIPSGFLHRNYRLHALSKQILQISGLWTCENSSLCKFSAKESLMSSGSVESASTCFHWLARCVKQSALCGVSARCSVHSFFSYQCSQTTVKCYPM